MDINKKAYTRLWVHFGPRGKDLCERGEWTHLEDLTKLHLLVKTTDYRPDPVREPLAPTSDFLHNLLLVGSCASDFLVVGIGGLLLFLQRLLASEAVDSSRASCRFPTTPYQELNDGRTSKGKA